MQPSFDDLKCLGPSGFHRLAVTRWTGAANAPVTICVHGLTRNSRDFDALADDLAKRGPVWAPDMPGRGRSDWLSNPADYGYPLYLADVAALIARTGADTVDFVGTSMGGLIGMMLASMPGSPIRRLVINDVGPFLPKAALERIGQYVGLDPHFADMAAAEAYLRQVHAPFGDLSDEAWHAMAVHGTRPLPGGGLALGYDPGIAQVFKGALVDVDLWTFYDRITCPTLVIRGAASDVLPAETAAEMTQRGPRAALVVVEGVGHAPALIAADQRAAITDFLEQRP